MPIPTQAAGLFTGSFQTARRTSSQKKECPSDLAFFTCYRRALSSAYLAPLAASTFQLPPGPTHVSGFCLATRDNLNSSTYIE